MYVFRRQNSPFFYAGGQFSVNDNACLGPLCLASKVCARHLPSVPARLCLCLASSVCACPCSLCLASTVCVWHLQSVPATCPLCLSLPSVPVPAPAVCACLCPLCLATTVCARNLPSVPCARHCKKNHFLKN